MPVVSVGLAVERDVVDPHVQIGPVNTHQEHQAAQRRMASGPRQNEANADGDFHDTGDEDPNGWIAQHGRDDGLKPGGVGEVLDADVDVHASKEKDDEGRNPTSS